MAWACLSVCGIRRKSNGSDHPRHCSRRQVISCCCWEEEREAAKSKSRVYPVDNFPNHNSYLMLRSQGETIANPSYTFLCKFRVFLIYVFHTCRNRVKCETNVHRYKLNFLLPASSPVSCPITLSHTFSGLMALPFRASTPALSMSLSCYGKGFDEPPLQGKHVSNTCGFKFLKDH